MFRYSLRELLYWWTIWVVGVSALTALMPASVALYIVTVWLLGTAFLVTTYGRGLSFAYAVLVGVVACLSLYVAMALRFPNQVPPFLLHFVVSLFFGAVTGTAVWGVALGADALATRFVRRHSA